MTTPARARRCGVPHPTRAISCQQTVDDAGHHDGLHRHVRRRDGVARTVLWPPYLSTFAALTRPLVGGRS